MMLDERIELALDAFWSAAYSEGRDQRNSDDEDRTAQKAGEELRNAIINALMTASTHTPSSHLHGITRPSSDTIHQAAGQPEERHQPAGDTTSTSVGLRTEYPLDAHPVGTAPSRQVHAVPFSSSSPSSVSTDDYSTFWPSSHAPGNATLLEVLENIELPVVGHLFVARGGATARTVGPEVLARGPDESSYLVRISDVTKALEPIRAALAVQSETSGDA